jgi:hypothetical protein
MRLVGWKPLFKGILRGFTTGEPPIGLTLIDCGVLVGTKGAWANPPVKPQLACLQRSGPGWSEFADRLEEDVRDDTGFSNISSGL